MSVYLSVYLSIYRSICLSVYLATCLSVCLSVYLSVCLSIYLSICLSVCPSVCLSVFLSVCMCVCVGVWYVCMCKTKPHLKSWCLWCKGRLEYGTVSVVKISIFAFFAEIRSHVSQETAIHSDSRRIIPCLKTTYQTLPIVMVGIF